MKKNILTYGLIAGIVVSVLMLSSVNYFSHCEGNVDYNTSIFIGYASMLLCSSPFHLCFLVFAIIEINTMKELSVLAKRLK